MDRRACLLAYLCGLLFAVGLGISGMTNRDKILGFLNLFGQWDPTLLLVFAASTTTYLIGYRYYEGRSKLLQRYEEWREAGRPVDRRLCGGAVLFGIGWGLMGLCPGPALTDLVTGQGALLLFTAAMLLGMQLVKLGSYKP